MGGRHLGQGGILRPMASAKPAINCSTCLQVATEAGVGVTRSTPPQPLCPAAKVRLQLQSRAPPGTLAKYRYALTRCSHQVVLDTKPGSRPASARTTRSALLTLPCVRHCESQGCGRHAADCHSGGRGQRAVEGPGTRYRRQRALPCPALYCALCPDGARVGQLVAHSNA